MMLDIFSLFYMLAYIMEHTTKSMDVMCTSIKIEYAGQYGFIMSMMMFYDLYFERTRKRILYYLEAFVCSVCVIAVFTMEHNHLFYTSRKLKEIGQYAVIQLKPGVLYFVFYISNLFIILHIELLGIQKLKTCKDRERTSCILMMAGPLFPLLSVLVKWSGVTHNYDLMALGILGILSCISVAVVKYDYLELIRNDSETDPLTGLSNRLFFTSQVSSYLQNQTHGAFIMLDVDNFKNVNDTFGHGEGDRVLVSLSDSLKMLVADEYFIARMGGDEFCIFLPNVTRKKTLTRFSQQLLSTFKEDQKRKELKSSCSCSIGIAIYNGSARTAFEEIYEWADNALYDSKNSGKGQWKFY
ncbi:diguanylate cyclase (GGDEF) domain-containing protein [[Clostridium] polysaccharolyticum]|uniref:Diguanylate cyclase (GGDEF) domain-containing protein n=2 Tax=[Clostridium] polysaccharolyticum TaxID=29364 RepID=A0A1I0FB83_9FIRM|nr:diguanylate cyclase (GGDEF) domain-containing protein [[Clostridium] polysaccharolyticum]